jgi:hypothetical protein
MGTPKMLNRIIVIHGEKQKLAKLFGHGMPFIRKALAGDRDTLEALKVRKVAIERGGIEVSPIKSNNTKQ